MSWLLEPWLWYTIIACIIVCVVPLLVIWLLISLPFPWNTILFVGIIAAAGILRGHREYHETHKP